MATNLGLDDRLILEVKRAGKFKTKKAAVTAALRSFLERQNRLKILEDFGTIDFDPSYDYKAERKRKRG